jgi:hypothetical protein
MVEPTLYRSLCQLRKMSPAELKDSQLNFVAIMGTPPNHREVELV